MQLKFDKKYLPFLLLLGLSGCIYEFLKPNPAKEEVAKWRSHLIPDGFSGHVIKKYTHRNNQLVLINAMKDSFHMICITQDLFDSVAVGDSVVKYANSNICGIIREDNSIRCNCYYEQDLY